MERNAQLPPPPRPQPQAGGLNGGIMHLKVMTEEQMEVLRKQIAAYATISEQLEELHRFLNHSDDHLAGGVRMGNPYSSSLMVSPSQKLSRRQRWNPTPEQLHILERVFDQEGIKTPNPPKVKEITAELAQHGQIAEPNVYNWFQNRRARLKKKQMLEAEDNNAESEAEMVLESFDAKVTKPLNFQPDQHVSKLRNEEFCQENDIARTGTVSIHSLQGCSKPSRDFAEMPTLGRMSWDESHIPLLNTENCKNTGETWWPNIS